ncbi:hypothetical protein IFM12275_67560 [Nocardia sputorum]|nr:hypothetical protein IFM12275_67560 [Nocardia sputorum]
MKLPELITVAALTALLSGCDLLPRTDTDQWVAVESSHSIQELCDYPKKFFAGRYETADLKVSVDVTKPMSEKIGGGNGCSYHKSERDYVGYISLVHLADSTTPANQVEHPARTLTIDGIRVVEVVKPIPDYADPATTRPWFELIAEIDGWEGKLGFKNGDEQGTQAGARVLVDMIRALKG